jgi:arsenite transporter
MKKFLVLIALFVFLFTFLTAESPKKTKSEGFMNYLRLISKHLAKLVLIDFLLALLIGSQVSFSSLNLKMVSFIAVYIMLYPMLTGMPIEKVSKAAKDYKLILSTLFFAFAVASLNAYVVANTVLASQPELALAIIMVGAIPCSNMLIGWTGIAGARVENALVIAVIGLLSIPVISPFIISFSGSSFIDVPTVELFRNLLLFILIPLVLGYLTRKQIIKKKGMKYFGEIKTALPGISASGVLIIIFFSVAKVADKIISDPILFAYVAMGLGIYYFIQTVLSVLAAKLLGFKYERGMILILGATASSQAISLSLAASQFSGLTVFALSFKPVLQVFYILFLIYTLGPWLKKFLGEEIS